MIWLNDCRCNLLNHASGFSVKLLFKHKLFHFQLWIFISILCQNSILFEVKQLTCRCLQRMNITYGKRLYRLQSTKILLYTFYCLLYFIYYTIATLFYHNIYYTDYKVYCNVRYIDYTFYSSVLCHGQLILFPH